MFASDTNRAQRVSRLLEAGGRYGLERDRLLRKIGLRNEQIHDPDDRVPLEKTIRLWKILANELDHQDLGLEVGSSITVQEGGVIGYAMLHSDSLLSSLRRIVRFAKLLNQRAELTLVDEGDRWRLQALNQPLIPGFRQPIDEGIAGLMACFHQIVGRRFAAADLHFSYPRPDDTSAHRKLFGSALQFDARAPAIILWDRDVRSATVSADPNLTRYLDEVAQIHLDALPQATTHAERVRLAVWPHLSEGLPSIQIIAGELALSTRSLQRRLREESSSFAEVVDELRHEKARLLLTDPHLAIYEVGYLLGYSDPSTFHRAFRRWEGTSPSRYRSEQVS